MSTLSTEEQEKIASFLENMFLPRGLGSYESACSIASINLALTNELTDSIPDCMSDIIGNWIICVQDRMPSQLRNSKEWKQLLPFAAGTGKDLERERLALITDWLWETVLPSFQKRACTAGFGREWADMVEARVPNLDVARNGKPRAGREASSTAHDLARLMERMSGYSVPVYALGSGLDVIRRATQHLTHDEWLALNPAGLLEKLIDAKGDTQ